MFRTITLSALLVVCTGWTAPTFAQTRMSSQKPSTTKSTSKAANVVFGTLVSSDAEQATLLIKPKTGADIPFRLTDKTLILKAKKATELKEFKPGDAVVVRFRKSSVGPASLYDLADRPSWEWLDRIRHQTTFVTLKEVTETGIACEEGADSAHVDYRVTDKSQIQLGGKAATLSDLKPGAKLYVSPRLLPGGGVMAIAITDTAEENAKAKERTKIYVSGTIRVWNPQKRSMTLHTEAGDDRELNLAPDCTIRLNSKDVSIAVLKPGINITAKLRRDEENERVVSNITIKSASSTRPKPATKPAPKKPTPKPK